jgi:hypothetical protein
MGLAADPDREAAAEAGQIAEVAPGTGQVIRAVTRALSRTISRWSWIARRSLESGGSLADELVLSAPSAGFSGAPGRTRALSGRPGMHAKC